MVMHTPFRELQVPTKIKGGVVECYQALPDRDGQYPACVVILNGMSVFKDTPYSTHLAYFDDDRDVWELSTGHYDMRYDRAVEDFRERVGLHV
jgi:hypothetical protein